MTKPFLLLLLFALSFESVICQNETNNWYFGQKAGLNFGNLAPMVLTDSAMDTPAGCSTISDPKGNLMFYTNGNTVWNKKHQIMTNGTDLAGDLSNTQSSIIIPKPNDPNVYYIFTTRENPTTSAPLLTGGLFYSEIQFSSQHPLGIVHLKNRRIAPSATERITAIHHAETNTIRVIAFGKLNGLNTDARDTFSIFNVTENGVQLPAIKSTQKTTLAAAGAMKFSPNGKYLAIADFSDRYIYVYLFDNDNLTFSLYQTLSADGFFIPINPYGIEFSQDSKNLYFTGKNNPNTSYLKKFNLESKTGLNEIHIIATSSEYNFGSLQLARDGTIYMALFHQREGNLTAENKLSIIRDAENPEKESGFELLAIDLQPGASLKGLPNFIQSFFRNRIIVENDCVNVPLEFTVDAYASVDVILWDFGDGNSSTLLNPAYQYSKPGKYKVKATITLKGGTSDLFKEVEVFPLPSLAPNQTIQQCDLDNDGISFFNLYTIDEKMDDPDPENTFYFYESAVDRSNDEPIANPEAYENKSNPQELFVKIVSAQGCEVVSNFYIETSFIELLGIEVLYGCPIADGNLSIQEGNFDLSPEGQKQTEIRQQFNIDPSSTLKFFATFEDAQTQTNLLPAQYQSSNKLIWLRVDNPTSGCNGIGNFQLVVNPSISLDIDSSYTICDPNLQPPIVLDGNSSNDRWEWRNGNGTILSTAQKFKLTAPGKFSLSVFKYTNGMWCEQSREFDVEAIDPPVFNQVLAGNYEITASVVGESNYQFSLDDRYYYGEGKSYTFYNVQPGIYTVYAKDIYNCEPAVETKVSFIGFSKYFTPNGDGYNDFWKIQGISKDFYSAATIVIYDRYGRLLHTMDLIGNETGWDGTYNGEKLQTNDYWFTATLINLQNEISTQSGHFSLIF